MRRVCFDCDLRLLAERQETVAVLPGLRLKLMFKRGRNILLNKLYKVLCKRVVVVIDIQYESL